MNIFKIPFILIFAFPIIMILSSCENELIDPNPSVEMISSNTKQFKSAIDYCGEPATNLLFAGQNKEAGEYTIGNDKENLYVTISTNSEWFITNAKLWIGTSLEELPMNKGGNVKLGKFPTNIDYNVAVQSATFSFPLIEFSDETVSDLFAAIHLDVYREFYDNKGLQTEYESAWGFGEDIGSKSWGWYNSYSIQSCEWKCGDPWTDERDGQIYQTVGIGNRCLFAENLKYIPHVSPPEVFGGIWVYDYYGNNIEDAKQHPNYQIYGCLYGLNEVNTMKLCPDGWYVATGLYSTIWDAYHSDHVAREMTSTYGWLNGGNGNNETGFNALPGGMKSEDGTFLGLGWVAYFMNPSTYGSSQDPYPHIRYYKSPIRTLLFHNTSSSQALIYINGTKFGYSVRCQKI